MGSGHAVEPVPAAGASRSGKASKVRPGSARPERGGGDAVLEHDPEEWEPVFGKDHVARRR